MIFIYKLPLVTALFLVAMFLALFSPWLTPPTVEKIVFNAVVDSQKNVIDGCGFNCKGCGVKILDKVMCQIY